MLARGKQDFALGECLCAAFMWVREWGAGVVRQSEWWVNGDSCVIGVMVDGNVWVQCMMGNVVHGWCAVWVSGNQIHNSCSAIVKILPHEQIILHIVEEHPIREPPDLTGIIISNYHTGTVQTSDSQSRSWSPPRDLITLAWIFWIWLILPELSLMNSFQKQWGCEMSCHLTVIFLMQWKTDN